MKTVFLGVCLLLLLGAERGWADEIIDMNALCTLTQPAPNQLEWSYCPPLLPKSATLEKPRLQIECDGPYPSALCDQRRDPCLAKMEAAMRAMDWYLPVGLQPIGDGRWQSFMQVSDTGHEAIIVALRRWREAKECWRDQP